jgi:pimeloyl-ACP methyl ester carboxylesterase
MDLVVNGARAFAATGGRPFDPALPAVVFVHGAGVDHAAWALQTRHFAHHGRTVLAVDLPAHGGSGGTPLATIPAMADWVVALLDAAGVERAALVGFSMGSLIALDAAARFPRRVRALAVMGVARRLAVHPDLLAAAEANDHKAIELILSWAFAGRGNLGGHHAPGLWMKGATARLFERARPGVLGVDLRACNDYEGAAEAAARVRCPTLVLWGDKDRMAPPKEAAALAQAIPGARVRALPGVGHLPMMEEPIAVTEALKEIL